MANLDQAVGILKDAEAELIQEIGTLEGLVFRLDGKRAELKRVRQSIRLLNPESEPAAAKGSDDHGRSLEGDLAVIVKYLSAQYGLDPDEALVASSATKYARMLTSVVLTKLGYSTAAIADALGTKPQGVAPMRTHFKKGMMPEAREKELQTVLALCREANPVDSE